MAEVLALSYYSRKEIQEAIYDFCKGRETVANFNNKFFSKRPDCLDYPIDVFNLAKKGATSFHCSEEIWSNPLKLSTESGSQNYNSLRIGWDLLIDIDSKYLDYSKIAAKLLIKALELHGIRSYGIKFSGSKGFHIIVPFKSFPEEFMGEKTKNMFPEWPRAIAGYLFSLIKEPMNKEILKMSGEEKLAEKGELILERLCPKCNEPSKKKKIGKYVCPNVSCRAVVESMKSNRKKMICPSCNGWMNRIEEKEIYYCEKCKINTALIEASLDNIAGEKRKEKPQFKEEKTTKSTEDSIDIVLVSPRHLFRAPYSLHEKTSLASVVLSKDSIDGFSLKDADPLKLKKIKNFLPDAPTGEAKELLARALENYGKDDVKKPDYSGKPINLEGLEITEDMYPPIIKKLLLGIKDDGRKRALSIILSFFSSLDFPKEAVEEKIREWNKKNYHPLREGYIRSQIQWHLRNKRMPPNYDKPIYKEFGGPLKGEDSFKNPINFTLKLAFMKKRKSESNKQIKRHKSF